VPDPNNSDFAESVIVLSEDDTAPSSVTAEPAINGKHLEGRPSRRYGAMALVGAVLLGGVAGFATSQASLTRRVPLTDESIRILFIADSSIPDEVVTQNGDLRFRQKLNVVNAGPDPILVVDIRGGEPGLEISGTAAVQEINPGQATYVDLNVAMSCELSVLNKAIPVEVDVRIGAVKATPTTLHRFLSLYTGSLAAWIEPNCGRFPRWSTVGVSPAPTR
jgi:hypothetical protein